MEGIGQPGVAPTPRMLYEEQSKAQRAAFLQNSRHPQAGSAAIAARSASVDTLIISLWEGVLSLYPVLTSGISLVAVGGYGRRELFPFSDVDLMFLLDPQRGDKDSKDAIRRLNQALWDAGLRASSMTRSLAECERFDPENVEFTLSLLDARHLTGNAALSARLLDRSLPRMLTRERKRILPRLLEVTRARHSRYGDTLFHLEPNIKECPGGLRDAHVCAWLARVSDPAQRSTTSPGFRDAREFLALVRVFLHLRHGRDDNTLDWQSQDDAAAVPLGIASRGSSSAMDAAYWMRFYFRHARSVERSLAQSLDQLVPERAARLPRLPFRRQDPPTANAAFELRQGRILFTDQHSAAAPLAPHANGDSSAHNASDSANDPEVALAIFATMARTGARLSPATESRLEEALPLLSAHLEDGPGLWRQLRAILTEAFAGRALRTMHALGILELVIPEFHGIDALVIRDAYHRYTVDEHTFVLIDTLHALRLRPQSSTAKSASGLDLWSDRFALILSELPHPALLFLAALLHDTGKSHSTGGHAAASARMAESLLQRLDFDPYESGLVLDIIRNHLEMSAALRRDVFDHETIRTFAARVQTPEALRMLTLFTYADIAAVHPDALTPWKAENLWRLHIATSNFLDRNVDDERVASAAANELDETIHRIHALLPKRRSEVDRFLDGLPRRYLQTRTPDGIRAHFELAALLDAAPGSNQIDFRYAPGVSEITLVTADRPMIFASMAGVLAAWGMNIITADAFSNAHGVIVDSFRFTDTFRTLELNASERTRFVESVRGVMSGTIALEPLLAARRRPRRTPAKLLVEPRLDFDNSASTHSTLLQTVAQDTPGLLRALALPIARHGCNIEVALVDTEGETAIDVFYLTYAGAKLEAAHQDALRRSLLEAIDAHAR